MKIVFLFLSLIPQVVVAQQVTFQCTLTNRLVASEKLVLTFLVDTKADKAYVVGNNGSNEVQVVPNRSEAIGFIEITDSGNIMTTTITNNGAAVHSRNTVLKSGLVATQFLGTCARR